MIQLKDILLRLSLLKYANSAVFAVVVGFIHAINLFNIFVFILFFISNSRLSYMSFVLEKDISIIFFSFAYIYILIPIVLGHIVVDFISNKSNKDKT